MRFWQSDIAGYLEVVWEPLQEDFDDLIDYAFFNLWNSKEEGVSLIPAGYEEMHLSFDASGDDGLRHTWIAMRRPEDAAESLLLSATVRQNTNSLNDLSTAWYSLTPAE